jgi:hypothetical protein
MERALIDFYCASYKRVPKQIVLDFDDTFDAVHVYLYRRSVLRPTAPSRLRRSRAPSSFACSTRIMMSMASSPWWYSTAKAGW